MSETLRLSLPLLSAAQAQKHVTVNEALQFIDAFIGPSIIDRDLTAPPGSPSAGDLYIVASSPTGDWAGRAGSIAYYINGAWEFLSPVRGLMLYVVDEEVALVYSGSAWVDLGSLIDTLQNLSQLGVNATADDTNRLSVSSSAILFNNLGNGVQVKLNKNEASDTTSFLFQTNWSGRAELGTTGDEDFHIKVSPDGSSWTEAMLIDGSTGVVSLPANGDVPFALTSLSHAISSDIALSASNTFYTGPTLSLAAGTWLVTFSGTFDQSSAIAETVTARISDGTNHYASQAASHGATATTLAFSLTAVITLAAATAINGQMATTSGGASRLMKAAAPSNPSGNTASLLSAIRIS